LEQDPDQSAFRNPHSAIEMKLSVVTPSYNQAPFLAATLQSVQEAASRVPGHEVEHIVMDGASTDQTTEILKNQTFARWKSERDTGQASAINKGWKESTGEIFAYLCSDDLWEANTLQVVLPLFERHPDVDVIYGDYFFLEGESEWKRRKCSALFSYSHLLAEDFISQPATFFRRRVYEKFGGLDESLHYCLDHEYWLRIGQETQWLYVAEPLAVMRQHSSSKTNSQLTKAYWESFRMRQRYGIRWKPLWDAVTMQCGGQYYYMAKRKWFESRGKAASGK
jgi:glycosyltransferase involved in cell wall biosynthesis